MKLPSIPSLTNAIASLDWNGHVELPHNDLEWLASQVLHILTPSPSPYRCELCNSSKLNIIPTRLGPICWECIEDMADNVESDREDLEG